MNAGARFDEYAPELKCERLQAENARLRAENERLRTALDAVRKFLPLTAFVSVNWCEEMVYPRSIAEEALESTNEKGAR